MLEDEDHSLSWGEPFHKMGYFLAKLFEPHGVFWIGIVARDCFLPFIPVRVVLFLVFLSSQIIDAAVDADPVDPGGKAGVVFNVVFLQVAVRFDKGLLEDVFGILFVFRVLVSQREDSLPVLFKKHTKCLRVALLGRLHNSSFSHSFVFHLSKRKKRPFR
jgi:hypothetical protein